MTEFDEAEAPAAPEAPEPTKGEIVPAQVLPDFRPVPRQTTRHDGWNPEVQREFIEALAETGSVRSACRAVGRADHGAYLLRRHPEADEFRRAWDAALDISLRRIEDVAMDRALNGHEQPVYSYGKLVGSRTVYNDRLLMFMLRNRAPERFGGMRQAHGAKGPNAVDKMELNRLKQQWRQDWERERFQQDVARHKENGETFAQFMRNRHVRWWTGMSPRAREAYLEFRRIESEDAYLDRSHEDYAEEDCEAICTDYQETCPTEGRSALDKLQEADGLGDEAVLGDAMPEPPQHRMIALTDDGGFTAFDPRRNDGRAKEWP